MATGAFSATLTVEGDGPAEVSITASGSVIRPPGTTAGLLLSANGQSRVVDLIGDSDRDSFVEQVRVAVDAPAECRFLALLYAGRDQAADVPALNVLSIDGEVRRLDPAPSPDPSPDSDWHAH